MIFIPKRRYAKRISEKPTNGLGRQTQAGRRTKRETDTKRQMDREVTRQRYNIAGKHKRQTGRETGRQERDRKADIM